MYKYMAFKGAEIVKSLCLRRLATEEICDIISNNACFIHYTRTKDLPYLKDLLDKNIHEKWVIERHLNKIDKQMSSLRKEFEKYNNFICCKNI